MDKSSYMVEFGRKVRYYRESIGMNQEELAMKLGYKDKSSITKVEKGVARVPAFKVMHFANALGVDVTDLITIEENPTAEEQLKVIKSNTIGNDSGEKLQHIMLILAQMNDEQISKAETLLATIFEND